jgi:hypothetical protein
MSRIVQLVVLLLLVLAAIWYLQSRVAEQPQTPREIPVDANALR